MKKLTFFVVAMAGSVMLAAQTTDPNQSGSTYVLNTGFYETIPVKDMPLQTDEDRANGAAHHEMLEARREMNRPQHPLNNANIHQETQPDPVVQSTDGVKTLSAPIVNFDGGSDNSYCPNDPNGAVGATQYVQMYNSAYSVYSKTGTLLKGPVDLKTIFTNIPNDDGDPVVLYDKFADRWFLSEFQVSKAPCGFSIAISKTGDATGAYYVYNFSNAAWTTNNYPDYLKFSMWTDGYYMTANLDPQQIMVLDRARMLAGKTSAGMIITNYTLTPTYFGGNNSLWNNAKIMDCDASALPPYGTPNYLIFFQNTNSGGHSDEIIIDKLVHDTTAKTLTISRWDSLPTASFNAFFNNNNGINFNTLAQPGVKSYSSKAVDALDGSFNFRVPFLMFTGYNSVVLSNTVNTGKCVAGIRWYELRQNTSTMHFTINQQATYEPTAGANRWNGSIAMDQDGDIALAYCMDDSVSTYPCIRYTGRMAADPLSTMTGTETTAVAGTTAAINCGNRWGDYSDMTLDTDGVTFWHCNEYDKGGNPANRIFSFRLTTPTGINNPIDNAEFKVYQSGSFINVIANKLPSDDAVQVDMFDVIGKQLSTRQVTPASGNIQTQINVNSLAKGIYFVRIGNINYQRVFKLQVN
ncbi:MAG TPA: T9SS type A sorting domain-containing protein [Bacteroidia bacterium]|jgi:hypothetical protein|nr:T9SS type A sorting domain-containing protein [Bacteroidia bacterium]